MSPIEKRMDEQRNSNPAHTLYTVRLHCAISRSNSISDETQDWTVVRCLACEIDFDVVDIALESRRSRRGRNRGKVVDAPSVIPCAGTPRNPVRSG
jgi:hypothetical protein